MWGKGPPPPVLAFFAVFHTHWLMLRLMCDTTPQPAEQTTANIPPWCGTSGDRRRWAAGSSAWGGTPTEPWAFRFTVGHLFSIIMKHNVGTADPFISVLEQSLLLKYYCYLSVCFSCFWFHTSNYGCGWNMTLHYGLEGLWTSVLGEG